MPKDLLGPDGSKPGDTFAAVIRGFAEGATALWRARPAMRAVTVVTIHRVAFGMITVLAILLLREHPEPTQRTRSRPRPDQSRRRRCSRRCTDRSHRYTRPDTIDRTCLVEQHLAGYRLACRHTNRLRSADVAIDDHRWGGPGLAGQAVKICADTAVQHRIHDDHRGRVFSLYDVVINIGLVVGVTPLHSPAQRVASRHLTDLPLRSCFARRHCCIWWAIGPSAGLAAPPNYSHRRCDQRAALAHNNQVPVPFASFFFAKSKTLSFLPFFNLYVAIHVAAAEFFDAAKR